MEFIYITIYIEEKRESSKSCSFVYRFVNKSYCVCSESRMKVGLCAWTKDINIYKTKTKTMTTEEYIYTCSGNSRNNKRV